MTQGNNAYKLNNQDLIAGIKSKADINLVAEFTPTSTQEIERLINLWDSIKQDASTPKEMKPLIQDEINGYYALLLKKGELARDIFKVSTDNFNLEARAQDIKDVDKTFPEVDKAKKRYEEQNKPDSKESLKVVSKDGKDVEEKPAVDAETELKTTEPAFITDSSDDDLPMEHGEITKQFKSLVVKGDKEGALSLVNSTFAVGHYIPKKSKQKARVWNERELQQWIKKMDNSIVYVSKQTETIKTKTTEVEDGPTSKIEDKPVNTDVNTAKGLDELRDILKPLFKSDDKDDLKKAQEITELAFIDSQYDKDDITKWLDVISSDNTDVDHLDILMPKEEITALKMEDFNNWLKNGFAILSTEEIVNEPEYKAFVESTTDAKFDVHAHMMSIYRNMQDKAQKHPENDAGESVAIATSDVENASKEETKVVAEQKEDHSSQDIDTPLSEYLSLDDLEKLIVDKTPELGLDEICSLEEVSKLVNTSGETNSFAKFKHLRKYVASIYNTAKQTGNLKELDESSNEIVYPKTMSEVKLVGTKMILEDGCGLECIQIWFKKFHKDIEGLNVPDEKIDQFIESFFKIDLTETMVKKQGPKLPQKISIDELKEKVKSFINEEDKQYMGVVHYARTLFRKAGYNTDKMELQEIKDTVDEIIKETKPELLEKYNQDKEDREKARKSQIIIDDKVFVKERLADAKPELWASVKDITTLGELENKALELCEGKDWQDALNMSIDLITSNVIEDAKNMTQEGIQKWFSETVLQAEVIEEEPETKELDEKYEGNDSKKWDTLKTSHNKNDFKHSIDDILTTFSDKQNLNKDIITAIKAGSGKYTSKQGRRKDAELHKFINNRRNNLVNKQK